MATMLSIYIYDLSVCLHVNCNGSTVDWRCGHSLCDSDGGVAVVVVELLQESAVAIPSSS